VTLILTLTLTVTLIQPLTPNPISYSNPNPHPSSLSTCDPGDHGGIFTVIDEAIKNKIRISVICLAAELYICR
jgi:hypothetical protein